MKDLELLGYKVRDVITGFEGIVETVGYDLYGCIQAVVKPSLTETNMKDGTVPDGRWFDVKRLEVIGKKPVMQQPDFDVVPGGSEKPSFSLKPPRS